MDGYYTPTNNMVSGALTSNAGLQAAQMPKVELPEIGAKMLLVIHPYGGVNLVDGENMVGGLDVVEVEVVAIKKSKTTLE